MVGYIYPMVSAEFISAINKPHCGILSQTNKLIIFHFFFLIWAGVGRL